MINNLVKRIRIKNDTSTSIMCCIEEMSELTKVLCKRERSSNKFNKKDLVEEVAHVLLMVSVIKDSFYLNEIDIVNEQINAVERMEGKND